MIKILLGGSPCTFWSIAQKNGRETEAEGMGWELFKNYLIAKEKFKPDYFLYENNKSAAQPIKDQISRELGVDLMYINSALVSAQTRQRFYAFNWEVEQPEDRGILLRDVLESGVVDREKAYPLLTTHQGNARDNLKKQHAQIALEPIKVLSEKEMDYMVRDSKGNYSDRWTYLQKPGESDKALCLTANLHKGVPYNICAEPVRIPDYGIEDKSRPVTACYAYKGCGEGSLASEAFPDNPNKQVRDYVAEPIRIGDIGSSAQAHRVYSPDGKSVCLKAEAGGQGGKTGLYATPIKTLSDGEIDYMFRKEGRMEYGYIQNADNDKAKCITANISKGVPYNVMIERADGKLTPVYEVRDGMITVKDKQYPIKLADGYYIIRKLTPVECERLQTLPDGYTEGVSNTQRYKGLGNGWTAEVIIHILNGVLKDVPRDEEIVVLSMYDGIGTGRYCLDKMGFTNVKYYAYEIDKYAKQIAMKNYPDIIQMGDAFDLRHPDWTIGY